MARSVILVLRHATATLLHALDALEGALLFRFRKSPPIDLR
jgi:hypothetical protein